MHVDGRWDGNEFTEDGRAAHGRLDREADVLAEAPATGADNEGDPTPVIAFVCTVDVADLDKTAAVSLSKIRELIETVS